MPQSDQSPPSDLESRSLPCETLAPKTVFYRSHPTDHSPLHFSRGNPENRYDDPQARFGVCYLSLSLEGAFAETFLRQRNGYGVAEQDLKTRSATQVVTTESLRLVSFYGAGLTRLRATAAVTAGDASAAQLWSGACFYHPDAPHGIRYRVRHDNDQFGVALFCHCRSLLRTHQPLAWRDVPELGAIIKRYGVPLI